MIFTLNATPRQTVRKSDLTTLRAGGDIPAVIYGPDMESISITLNKADLSQKYKKSFAEVSFWEIELEGKKYHTILKAKQIHPVTRHFLHADFLMVSEESMMEIDIPIKFTGEAIGTKEGGMVDVLQRHVKVTCKATDIPEDLELNVSHLKVGDSLHVSDLPKGKWTIKDHADIALVVVHPKKKEAPVAVAEEAEAEATPED